MIANWTRSGEQPASASPTLPDTVQPATSRNLEICAGNRDVQFADNSSNSQRLVISPTHEGAGEDAPQVSSGSEPISSAVALSSNARLTLPVGAATLSSTSTTSGVRGASSFNVSNAPTTDTYTNYAAQYRRRLVGVVSEQGEEVSPGAALLDASILVTSNHPIIKKRKKAKPFTGSFPASNSSIEIDKNSHAVSRISDPSGPRYEQSGSPLSSDTDAARQKPQQKKQKKFEKSASVVKVVIFQDDARQQADPARLDRSSIETARDAPTSTSSSTLGSKSPPSESLRRNTKRKADAFARAGAGPADLAPIFPCTASSLDDTSFDSSLSLDTDSALAKPAKKKSKKKEKTAVTQDGPTSVSDSASALASLQPPARATDKALTSADDSTQSTEDQAVSDKSHVSAPPGSDFDAAGSRDEETPGRSITAAAASIAPVTPSAAPIDDKDTERLHATITTIKESDLERLSAIQKATHKEFRVVSRKLALLLPFPQDGIARKMLEDRRAALDVASDGVFAVTRMYATSKDLCEAVGAVAAASAVFKRLDESKFGEVLLDGRVSPLRQAQRAFIDGRRWFANEYLDSARPALISALEVLEKRLASGETVEANLPNESGASSVDSTPVAADAAFKNDDTPGATRDGPQEGPPIDVGLAERQSDSPNKVDIDALPLSVSAQAGDLTPASATTFEESLPVNPPAVDTAAEGVCSVAHHDRLSQALSSDAGADTRNFVNVDDLDASSALRSKSPRYSDSVLSSCPSFSNASSVDAPNREKADIPVTNIDTPGPPRDAPQDASPTAAETQSRISTEFDHSDAPPLSSTLPQDIDTNDAAPEAFTPADLPAVEPVLKSPITIIAQAVATLVSHADATVAISDEKYSTGQSDTDDALALSTDSPRDVDPIVTATTGRDYPSPSQSLSDDASEQSSSSTIVTPEESTNAASILLEIDSAKPIPTRNASNEDLLSPGRSGCIPTVPTAPDVASGLVLSDASTSTTTTTAAVVPSVAPVAPLSKSQPKESRKIGRPAAIPFSVGSSAPTGAAATSSSPTLAAAAPLLATNQPKESSKIRRPPPITFAVESSAPTGAAATPPTIVAPAVTTQPRPFVAAPLIRSDASTSTFVNAIAGSSTPRLAQGDAIPVVGLPLQKSIQAQQNRLAQAQKQKEIKARYDTAKKTAKNTQDRLQRDAILDFLQEHRPSTLTLSGIILRRASSDTAAEVKHHFKAQLKILNKQYGEPPKLPPPPTQSLLCFTKEFYPISNIASTTPDIAASPSARPQLPPRQSKESDSGAERKTKIRTRRAKPKLETKSKDAKVTSVATRKKRIIRSARSLGDDPAAVNNETPDSESSTGHSSAKVDMLRKLREYLDREKEMDEECRAMYTEMSPKDKEIEVMRLEDAPFVAALEFVILVMWALSLTKSHGESINELSKWILADQSNRQKLLWRYFTHSNAPARQWMLDFAAALENGERPPDLPEGLPVLFSHVPKSKELQSEMHDPVIYAVVAEASRERGPNEAVGEAVKRARDEGIDLNPLTLMLVYVGIARGVKAFIGRYQGYLKEYKHLRSRQARTLFGSPDSEPYLSDNVLPLESDKLLRRVCLLRLPIGISQAEGALFEGVSTQFVGAVCTDALYERELAVEMETEDGKAILEMVFGFGGVELVTIGKAAMQARSHLKSQVLGMNRVNPVAHGRRGNSAKSAGQTGIRTFTQEFISPLHSPQGLEIGFTSTRKQLYLPQINVASPPVAVGIIPAPDVINLALERPQLVAKEGLDWSKISHCRLALASPTTPNITSPLSPSSQHPIMTSFRLRLAGNNNQFAIRDLVTEDGARAIERWIIGLECGIIRVANENYRSAFTLEQLLPRLEYLDALRALAPHDGRIRKLLHGLRNGLGIPMLREVRAAKDAYADHPAGTLRKVRLSRTKNNDFGIAGDYCFAHPSLEDCFGKAEIIYLNKVKNDFWIRSAEGAQLKIPRYTALHYDDYELLEPIWSGIMRDYENLIEEEKLMEIIEDEL